MRVDGENQRRSSHMEFIFAPSEILRADPQLSFLVFSTTAQYRPMRVRPTTKVLNWIASDGLLRRWERATLFAQSAHLIAG